MNSVQLGPDLVVSLGSDGAWWRMYLERMCRWCSVGNTLGRKRIVAPFCFMAYIYSNGSPRCLSDQHSTICEVPMKVFSLPESVPAPIVDYSKFNMDAVEKDEKEHQEKLKATLISLGYKGTRTGEIVRFQVADGHAQYMFADGGEKSGLVHLPYGDAYQYRDVSFLPRSEILRRMDAEKKFNEALNRL